MAHRLLLLAIAALVMVGCGEGVETRAAGTSGGSETASAEFDSAGICDALARIAASDRRASLRTEGVTRWRELQPLVVDGSTQAADLYDEALAVAPEELTGALTQIGDLTRELADVAATSRSQAAFQRDGQRLDGFAEAQTAVPAINGYTRLNCGFTFADN